MQEEKKATIAERNRAIKKELVKQYGKNVIVKGDRGTAYGWLNIKITLPTPAGHVHQMDSYNRCNECREMTRKEKDNIRSVCHKVAKEIGSYIGSYYADDGYNTPSSNILATVEYEDTKAEAKPEATQEEIKAILDSMESHWVESYRPTISDEKKMGILMAKYFKWNGLAILKATYAALEDSNFHTDNESIQKLINQYERN